MGICMTLGDNKTTISAQTPVAVGLRINKSPGPKMAALATYINMALSAT